MRSSRRVATNPIRPWLARLQHRFSPRRVRLGSMGHAPLPGGGSDAVLCLVGRELCLFTRLDASKTPLRERKAFIALAVRRAAPFADPDFDVAWNADGTAAVWYWSRARVAALVVDVPGRRRRFVAEALYVGQPHTDSVELLALTEGVEARVWRAGQLCASRWWAQPPSSEHWHDFMRGVGQASASMTEAPAPIPATPVQTPWGKRALDADALHLSGLEQYLPRAALAAGCLLLLAVGMQLGEIVRARLAVHHAQTAANDLDAPLARILDARQNADQAKAEIMQLIALRSLRPTTSLMAELTRAINDRNWQLRQWNQPTPDTVEIRIAAANSNPETLVSALEASPMFRNVVPEIHRNNDITLRAFVVPPPSWTGGASP